MSRILIAGCGYVGTAVARSLESLGDQVWGVRRHADALPSFIRPVIADVSDARALSRALPAEIDGVVYSVSPDDGSDASYARAFVSGLSNVITAVTERGAERLVFVSSTSVYAQQDGEWVDELSPTEPMHHSGQRLLEAERKVLEAPLLGISVRAGGIYGPGRTRLLDRIRQGEQTYVPGRYTNRIFRDDLATAIAHLLHVEKPDGAYVAVDDDPAAERDVFEWLAARLNAPQPQREERMEGRRARSNKRCRNTRLRSAGVEFRYPTFREGYGELLESGTKN